MLRRLLEIVRAESNHSELFLASRLGLCGPEALSCWRLDQLTSTWKQSHTHRVPNSPGAIALRPRRHESIKDVTQSFDGPLTFSLLNAVVLVLLAVTLSIARVRIAGMWEAGDGPSPKKPIDQSHPFSEFLDEVQLDDSLMGLSLQIALFVVGCFVGVFVVYRGAFDSGRFKLRSGPAP